MADAAYIQLHVDVPVDVAAARNRARHGNDRVPDDVFARLAAAWESPSACKHVFERDTVVMDNMACDDEGGEHAVARLWQRLDAHWRQSGPACRSGLTQAEQDTRKAQGQAGNAASEVHSWDVRARQAISAAVSAGMQANTGAALCRGNIHGAAHTCSPPI